MGHYLAKGSNDLGPKRPDVARQLDPELNGGLRAEDLHAHAGAMVWWRGSCGHVWREKVSMRSMRVDDSCPYCKNRKLLRGFNDLATTHSELVAEWDFERNGDLGPDRRDRQLQQARLVEVQRGPRVVRPHSEPGAQGRGGPGC